MLVQVMRGGTNGYGPHPLLVKLLDNARFRAMFVNTYADWLNSRVLRSVELARFDAMKAVLDPFIAEYDLRWPGTHNWNSMSTGRDILSRRNGIRRNQLRSNFGLGSDQVVTLQSDPTQGLIRCNSIVVDADTPGVASSISSVGGNHFENQPITLEALPRDGYRFVGWQVRVNGANLPPVAGDPVYYSRHPAITVALTGATEVTAAFTVVTRTDMHVWNFENLLDPFNPTSSVGGGLLAVAPASGTSVSAASQGFTSGHLRVNNPLGTVVQWSLPTTGYQAVKLGYVTRRSGSGAGTQTLSYTLDGSSWTVLQSYAVADADPQAQGFDFSNIPGSADNARFAVRVEFTLGGGGTSGNNRFDNVVLSGIGTRTLLVETATAAGVNMTVSPPDANGLANGTTSFSRHYQDGMVVNLSAPPASGGTGFQKWQLDGVDLATRPAIQVTMDADHTLTAVYAAGAPVITEQPSSIAIATGGSATFRVAAGGAGTLSYQWRFNGTAISGAEADTYTIHNVQAEHAGSYEVVVANATGTVTSDPALLEIASLQNASFEQEFTGWTTSGNLEIQAWPRPMPPATEPNWWRSTRDKPPRMASWPKPSPQRPANPIPSSSMRESWPISPTRNNCW